MAPPENNKVSLRRTKVIDPESSCQTYPFQESSKIKLLQVDLGPVLRPIQQSLQGTDVMIFKNILPPKNLG
jgi:hypothetical protein